MTFRKYRVFNYTLKKFETLYISAVLEVGQVVNLPQGKLQAIELIKEF